MSITTAAIVRNRIRSALPDSAIAVFEIPPHGSGGLRYDAVFESTVVGLDRVLHDGALLGVFHGAKGVAIFDEIHKGRLAASKEESR